MEHIRGVQIQLLLCKEERGYSHSLLVVKNWTDAMAHLSKKRYLTAPHSNICLRALSFRLFSPEKGRNVPGEVDSVTSK